MQELRPQLTQELARHIGKSDVWHAAAFPTSSFREVVEHVARLAYRNRSQLLFFRGQDKDYQSKAGGTTLYPAIYRGDVISRAELRVRFSTLAAAERALLEVLRESEIEGYRDISRKRYIQWSLLQHYEVAATPLLDVTQSLRVACSFAQRVSTTPKCFVYVLGLPYPTNRISINSEEDVVNIRLLSICPPAALRPYYQEGYMTGTPDVTDDFDSKTELDGRNRLIAKFEIPRAKTFWNAGFEAIPERALYPSGDAVEELCKELVVRVERETSADVFGQLLVEWARFEEQVMPLARQLTERNISSREAISSLARYEKIPEEVATKLNQVRRVRNMTAHTPGSVKPPEAARALADLQEILRVLDLDRRK